MRLHPNTENSSCWVFKAQDLWKPAIWLHSIFIQFYFFFSYLLINRLLAAKNYCYKSHSNLLLLVLICSQTRNSMNILHVDRVYPGTQYVIWSVRYSMEVVSLMTMINVCLSVTPEYGSLKLCLLRNSTSILVRNKCWVVFAKHQRATAFDTLSSVSQYCCFGASKLKELCYHYGTDG